MSKNISDLHNFWKELKRRKVVRSAFVYVAVAWAILEASDTIFPRLGLPDWTVTFVLILLIIFFILVIILTWVYDITPEGIKVTGDMEESQGGHKKTESTPEVLTDSQSIPVPGDKKLEDLQQRVIDLETQLVQANTISLRKAFPLLLKRIGYPLLLISVLVLFVVFKKDIASLIGIGDKAREEARLHNANATLYIESGDLQSAAAEVEMALELNPEYSYAWSNKAVITYLKGDLEKAIVETVRAIEFDSRNSKAPYNLAFYLDDKDNKEEAIRWYRKAIEIDSTYQADSVYVAASSALGRLYNAQKRPVDAMLVLNRSLRRFPHSRFNYLVYRNLGNAYLLSEQDDSAIKNLEISDRLMPGEKLTIQYLAIACESAGDIDKSLDLWKKYISLESDTSKANEAVRHRKELAVRQLQEILK
jgi:tetratricopeptide (TPR) repeat protein